MLRRDFLSSLAIPALLPLAGSGPDEPTVIEVDRIQLDSKYLYDRGYFTNLMNCGLEFVSMASDPDINANGRVYNTASFWGKKHLVRVGDKFFIEDMRERGDARLWPRSYTWLVIGLGEKIKLMRVEPTIVRNDAPLLDFPIQGLESMPLVSY